MPLNYNSVRSNYYIDLQEKDANEPYNFRVEEWLFLLYSKKMLSLVMKEGLGKPWTTR